MTDMTDHDPVDQDLLDALGRNYKRMIRAQSTLNTSVRRRNQLIGQAVERAIDPIDIAAATPDITVAAVRTIAARLDRRRLRRLENVRAALTAPPDPEGGP